MVLRCKPTTGQFVSLFTVAESLLTGALSPRPPPQLQLQGFSPCMKGQETDSHRYGIFGQQPSEISSQRDNKENMPEVSDAVCFITRTLRQNLL